jgi:hypothetical protein
MQADCVIHSMININDLFLSFGLDASKASLQFAISDFLVLQANPESARYLISTIVQSEAAIIAIIFSLTIVAIQIEEYRFSTLVSSLIGLNNKIKILTYYYILVIAYSLWILRLIDTKGAEHINSMLGLGVFLTYFFGIIAIAAIVPFAGFIIKSLNLQSILNMLTGILVSDLRSEFQSDHSDGEINPLQPITSIIINSLNRYDEASVISCLDAIELAISSVIREQNMSKKNQRILSIALFSQVTEIANLSFIREDIYVLTGLEEMLEKIGKQSAATGNCSLTNDICNSICEFGCKAAEYDKYKFEKIVNCSLRSLINISIITENSTLDLSYKIDIASTIATKLGEIGDFYTLNGQKEMLEIIQILGELSVNYSKFKHFDTPTMIAAELLGEFTLASMKNKFDLETQSGLSSLKEAGENSIQHDLNGAFKQVIESIYEIIRGDATDDVLSNAVIFIESLGFISAKEKSDEKAYLATLTLRNSMLYIIRSQRSKEAVDVFFEGLEGLRSIGKIAVANHLTKTIKEIIYSIETSGIELYLKTLENYEQIPRQKKSLLFIEYLQELKKNLELFPDEKETFIKIDKILDRLKSYFNLILANYLEDNLDVSETQVNEILRLYDESIKLYPENFHALISKANLLKDLDRIEEALATFEQIDKKLADSDPGYLQTKKGIIIKQIQLYNRNGDISSEQIKLKELLKLFY